MLSFEEIFPIVLIVTTITLVSIFWRKTLFRLFGLQVNEGNDVLDQEQSTSLLGYELTSRKSSFQDIPWSNRMSFTINGETMEIVNPDPSTLLANYIRDQLVLKGTKLGCEEGGCGACSVVLQDTQGKFKAVNSCLRLLCANDGQSITTIEGIGSVNSGLSEEQKRLVANNGTQCGFCTPGWITAMHALLESSAAEQKTLSASDIDEYFDGNICRCTGYRPIMQAFHSFCGSHGQSGVHQQCSNAEARANPHLCSTGRDMEDMTGECEMHVKKTSQVPVPRKTSSKLRTALKPLHFFNPASGKRYIRPVNFDQLCAALREFNAGSNYGTVKILGGNTSIGVTKYLNNSAPFYYPDEFSTMVDINQVPELNTKLFDSNTKEIVIGAATTINECITLLRQFADPNTDAHSNNKDINHHSIFSVTAHHLGRIANTQVRNAASWAGNLMIFMQYKSFPSDAVLAFTNAYARLQLSDSNGNRFDISMEEFLSYTYESFKAQGLFIVSISMKESSSLALYQTVAETFKVAQREHNAHAYVDGGFNFQLSSESKSIRGIRSPPTCNTARVVFGGVSQTIFIATRTQKVLQNAPLNGHTLRSALAALQQDLVAVGINEDSVTLKFLMSVMQSNLYSAFMRCYKVHDLPANVISALHPWSKPPSRGVEVFPLNRNDQPSVAPVGKPVHKLEAPIQSTGEAIYPSDENMPANGLYGEIVFSTKCAVKLLSIDPSAALAVDGVIAVYTAADIAGNNSIGNGNELFVSLNSEVPCVGAPLAVIVATSDAIATKAASLVKVTYSDSRNTPPPVTNLNEAINRKSFYEDIDGISTLAIGNADQAMSTSTYRAKGRLSAGGQYHFYMETQTATATLVDGKVFRVTCGTQDPTNYQTQIASVLGLPSNQVVVQCARTGGGFGGKLSGGLYVSAAATLCTSKLHKPVKIFNSRAWDMTMQGGREEWIADYEVGFSADGKIQAVTYEFYIDAGSAMNDSIGALYMGMHWADNAYFLPNYRAHATLCKTNTPSRTSMRAPGVVQTCLITEMVVERVATELKLPLASVQQTNFIKDGESAVIGQVIIDCTLQNVWNKVIHRSHYQERLQRINQFNSQNLWRKRGIACCPVKYGMGWAGYNAGVRLNVRSTDGYVVLSHNGVEIGQGINTKVVQAVAMSLGIDISLIRVEKTSTDAVTNGGCTGGSGTSEVVVQAALNACATLNARLDPYRAQCRSGPKHPLKTSEWVQLLQSLPYEVSLNVEGWFSPSQNPNQQEFQYFVYAACVTEVELNVLSGEVHVLASELVYDCGRSLNPAVDIGQVEGGLMMGIGYFFNERVKYEEGTGMLKSVGTWEYKPPLAQDIPSILNVTFIANAYNKDGILGSKAVGEPPYIISNSAYFALKVAIASARQDAAAPGYFNLEVPCSVDVRQTACLVDPSRFVL